MTYLLTAAGVIFLSVIVSLLVPEGRLNKTITFAMRIISIYVLIQPIAGLLTGTAESVENESVINYGYVSAVYSDWQSKELEILLEEKFGCGCECSVEVDYSGGEFEIISVTAKFDKISQNFADEIYEYLEELGYINISVYADGG